MRDRPATINGQPARRLSFGGHDSFPFRYGWIRKGVLAANEDPHAFQREDAVCRLGVGKNMVRSIRTWCLATQMLREQPSGRPAGLEPTEVAKSVFLDAGGDPYLEDPGTLWLLHWLLLTNGERLSLWNLAFMESRENEFTKEDLLEIARGKAAQLGQPIDPKTVARDAEVFVRTYVASRRCAAEESFDCPLAELGLVAQDGDRLFFVVGPKRTLPPWVFGYALLEFLCSRGESECTLSDATYLPGSPGQAFRLDEDAVVALSRELQHQSYRKWLVDVDGPIRRLGVLEHLEPLQLLRRSIGGRL
jgi:hypothetical protein